MTMSLFKKKSCLLLGAFLLIGSGGAAAQSADTVQRKYNQFQKFVRISRPLSYITFGQGLGNLEPLLFEAQLSPSFFVSRKKGSWVLQLSPHIILRMKNKRSFPVENPSYKVPLSFHLNLGFWGRSFLQKLFYDKAYLSTTFQHHSNGQDGPFFWKNGGVNIKNGSFSTNSISFALTMHQPEEENDGRGFSILRLYYEHHLSWLGFEEKIYPYALKELYGLDRIMLQYNNFNLSRTRSNSASKFLQNSRFMSNAGWIMGTMKGIPADDIQERLLLSLKYAYHPSWMNELSFFAEFFQGQDYYNMRFERNLSIVRVGLISDPLKLGTVSDVFN